ncbi:MAG: TatD family hydrolase, partial [Kiritimatiellae bacterium]|nr:TatD family hydrolase [Kiritimatiellia bacterium]
MRLFDAHCHLQDDRIADVDTVLRRAREAGVERLSCCGSSEEDWEAVFQIVGKHPEVIPSFGLHPYYVAGRTPRWKEILREYLAKVPSGVGEAGLDHALENRDDAAQEEVFRAQIEIARELGRPLSVHCRRAWDRMLSFLGETGAPPAGIIFHAYSGSPELVRPLVELGGFISFSGSITRSGNKRGHRSAREVPADRLLIETDAPDM